jgi:hypothetical protein
MVRRRVATHRIRLRQAEAARRGAGARVTCGHAGHEPMNFFFVSLSLLVSNRQQAGSRPCCSQTPVGGGRRPQATGPRRRQSDARAADAANRRAPPPMEIRGRSLTRTPVTRCRYLPCHYGPLLCYSYLSHCSAVKHLAIGVLLRTLHRICTVCTATLLRFVHGHAHQIQV